MLRVILLIFHHQDPPDGRQGSRGLWQSICCQGDGSHLCAEPELRCWHPVKGRWCSLTYTLLQPTQQHTSTDILRYCKEIVIVQLNGDDLDMIQLIFTVVEWEILKQVFYSEPGKSQGKTFHKHNDSFVLWIKHLFILSNNWEIPRYVEGKVKDLKKVCGECTHPEKESKLLDQIKKCTQIKERRGNVFLFM